MKSLRSIWDSPLEVALLAGLGGAAIGYRYSNWADILTNAFYHAGIAVYPDGNVTADWLSRTFTLPVQIAALLLSLGVTPGAVSTIVYAAQALLIAQAAALVIYALCRNAPLAVAGGLTFCVTLAYAGTTFYSDYLIAVFNPSTHGALALGLALLSIGQLGVGWRRGAGITVAASFAVHPLMAMWSLIWTALAVFVLRREQSPKPFVVGLAIGVAIAAISAVIGFTFAVRPATGFPPAPPEYLEAFLAYWDYHRNAGLSVTHELMMVQIALIIAVAGAALWTTRTSGRPERGMLLVLGLSGAAGLVLYAVFHAFHDHLPTIVMLPIPNRFINIPIALTFAVLCGMLARFLPHPLAATALMAVVIPPLLRSANAPPIAEPIAAIGFALLILLLLLTENRTVVAPDEPAIRERPRLIVTVICWGAAIVAAAVPVYLRGGPYLSSGTSDLRFLTEWLDQVPGPVAAADNYIILELRAYLQPKPLLIDLAALDSIPYFPNSAPRTGQILLDVYGVDYFNPPEVTKGKGQLVLRPSATSVIRTVTQDHWESLSPEQWAVLGREYSFSGIVAPSNWAIQLNPLDSVQFPSKSELTLYRLP